MFLETGYTTYEDLHAYCSGMYGGMFEAPESSIGMHVCPDHNPPTDKNICFKRAHTSFWSVTGSSFKKGMTGQIIMKLRTVESVADVIRMQGHVVPFIRL